MPDFKFELRIDDQVINASVKLPAEAIRPVDLLPILQGFSNAVLGAACVGESVSCTAGCAACCRQVVPLSETEAIYLTALIDEMPPERKAAILDRFEKALQKIDAAGLTEKLTMESLRTAEERRHLGDEYLAARIDCPFLENELCVIHQHRPLACREHLVTSPPENCWNPTAGSIEMVKMPRRMSRILYRFGDGVGNGPLKFLPLTHLFQFRYPEQPRLPGPQIFENFFREVTAPTKAAAE